MSVKLFGHRVLLKYEKPAETKIGNLYIPDVAGKHDLHRTGRVEVVGDGFVTNPVTKQVEAFKPLVQKGDLVMFQINDVMRWAQIFRYLKDDLIYMLQTELIARLHGEKISLDTFEILGDYVLVKPQLRLIEGKILLPNTVQSPERIQYTAIQKGATVDLPFEIGQEVICNHGRVNPVFIPVMQKSGIVEQQEYGYVLKDFVNGVVDDDHALQA